MTNDAYEFLALVMRYVFVLIGALVLLRAYRWMRRDSRAYHREMRALPDAGLVGEIVDLRTGKSQPLPREGDMGASRECDIHVKGAGVLRHHVRFSFEEGKGILITPSRWGKTFLGGQEMRTSGYALHGSQLQLGDAVLRMRLFAGLKVPHPVAFQQDASADLEHEDGPFPVSEEEVFLGSAGTPSPFDFADQEADAYAPPVPSVPFAPAEDYEGGYTEDGQMTWQYAYSLEELRQAQQAAEQLWDPQDENDEALPYKSPLARHRRRRRS